MVCERAVVGIVERIGGAGGAGGVKVGRGVVVESEARVEAREVGEGSVVGVRARVGRGAVVGKVGGF